VEKIHKFILNVSTVKKIIRLDQLVDSWTTLPRSANIALGCANAIPTLVEIDDSLKGKIENVGQIINENENKIMKEYSSFTTSSGITGRSART
jgi:hypothetical protein